MQEKLVQPHRRFLKEGAVVAEPSLKDTSLKYCHFFLFNDILLQCTQKNSDRYQLKQMFNLGDIKIVPLPTETKPNAFRVLTADEYYTFSTSTKVEKDSWIESLNAAIFEFKKQSMHRRVLSQKPISPGDMVGYQ
jgi:hypothetical protein